MITSGDASSTRPRDVVDLAGGKVEREWRQVSLEAVLAMVWS